MMPTVNIPAPIFQRLQNIATPLVDDMESVIRRLLDFYEENKQWRGKEPQIPSEGGVRVYDAQNPPDLTFTRLVRASCCDHELIRPKWNRLVQVAHEKALDRVGNINALRTLSRARIVEGFKEDKGYKYLPDSGISIQNVDAIEAWLICRDLAQSLDCPIEVEFEWRRNNKVSPKYAGKTGKMAWFPSEGYLRNLQASLDEWSSPEDKVAYDDL